MFYFHENKLGSDSLQVNETTIARRANVFVFVFYDFPRTKNFWIYHDDYASQKRTANEGSSFIVYLHLHLPNKLHHSFNIIS